MWITSGQSLPRNQVGSRRWVSPAWQPLRRSVLQPQGTKLATNHRHLMVILSLKEEFGPAITDVTMRWNSEDTQPMAWPPRNYAMIIKGCWGCCIGGVLIHCHGRHIRSYLSLRHQPGSIQASLFLPSSHVGWGTFWCSEAASCTNTCCWSYSIAPCSAGFFFFPQVWRASTRTTAAEPFFTPWHLVRFHSLVLSPVQQVVAGEWYGGKAQEQSSSAWQMPPPKTQWRSLCSE